MTSAIGIAGFDSKFQADPDPWGTFAGRDEARKRAAIKHAIGARSHGRVLELAAGNGSNSHMILSRSLRLVSCDGAPTAVDLTRQNLSGRPRAKVEQCVLPEELPDGRFNLVVAAEILYYLSPTKLARLASNFRRLLSPNGSIVLAHHHLRFDDAATQPSGVHERFIGMLPFAARNQWKFRNSRWVVERYARIR